MYPLIPFLLLIFFQLSSSNAQVTDEGGPPSGFIPPNTVSITRTDSVAPSGATPPSYYSTAYPQGTIIASDQTTSSNTKTKVILGVVLSLSILLILVATTFFIIRRRMRKASAARQRRASWLSHWVPEPKPSSLHQGRNGGETGTPPPTEYPFALNMSTTQKPPPASPLNQDV